MNQPDPGPVPDLLERLGDRSTVPLLPLADIERNVRHRRRRTRAIGLTAAAVLIGATALGASQILGPADDAGSTASDDTPAEVLQPVDLEGAWNVTTIRGDDGILTQDVAFPGGPVTLTFDNSDSAWGTTECNNFDAEVQRGPEPGDLRVTMLRGTAVGCDETSQRRLAEVRSATATSDTTAALLDEAGDIVLELQRQPFPDGQWTPDTVDGSEVSLVFENGSLSGNISCNPVNGTYVVDLAQATVQFDDDIAVGEALCGGDSSVLAAVRRVEHWSQTYGSQLLYDANWEVIAELEPLTS